MQRRHFFGLLFKIKLISGKPVRKQLPVAPVFLLEFILANTAREYLKAVHFTITKKCSGRSKIHTFETKS
jgi:hypothetical protein